MRTRCLTSTSSSRPRICGGGLSRTSGSSRRTSSSPSGRAPRRSATSTRRILCGRASRFRSLTEPSTSSTTIFPPERSGAGCRTGRASGSHARTRTTKRSSSASGTRFSTRSGSRRTIWSGGRASGRASPTGSCGRPGSRSPGRSTCRSGTGSSTRG